MKNAYIILIRGINVGGKNKVSMAELRGMLEDLGFTNVSTYIASGNVMLSANTSPEKVQEAIEKALPNQFRLDSELIKVRVLTHQQLQEVVDQKPKGFGDNPEKFYSDVLFMMNVSVTDVLPVFNPREGVDRIWPGKTVIYSQRLGSERTKSRLNKIISSPYYQSMTIRSWSTVTKLLHRVAHEATT